MDEETNKIKQHIDTEREQLGRNFDEIEDRVKSATDLKVHFDKHTGWIIGAAVATGFLLSRSLRKSSASAGSTTVRSIESRNIESAPRSTHAISKHLSRVSETVDDIFDGLAGVVADKLRSFVADAVPGFQEHYAPGDRQRGRSAVNQIEPEYFNRSSVK